MGETNFVWVLLVLKRFHLGFLASSFNNSIWLWAIRILAAAVIMLNQYFIEEWDPVSERFKLTITVVLRTIVIIAWFRAHLRIADHFEVSEAVFAQVLIEIQKFLDSFLTLFKPLMCQRLSCWGAICWIWIQHLLQKISTSSANVFNIFINRRQIAYFVVLKNFNFIRSSKKKSSCD